MPVSGQSTKVERSAATRASLGNNLQTPRLSARGGGASEVALKSSEMRNYYCGYFPFISILERTLRSLSSPRKNVTIVTCVSHPLMFF
jgi:hypothetical protein